MIDNEWRQGNRLPWGTLVAALAIGVAVLTASGVESRGASRTTGEPATVGVTVLPQAAERLARRFGVRRELASVIYGQARRAGLEPALVFGVIATESGFDPDAIGSQGERGLMQIKPSTARAYDRWITADALHDPELNVRLGLKHLKREVEYFGDPILGLMSYHMGRSRLERQLADGARPRDRYVERVLSSCGRACA